MEYRTDKQWKEIADSAINGNWTQAGKECADYGFWAHDLIKKFKEDDMGLEATDLAILAESAMTNRI